MALFNMSRTNFLKIVSIVCLSCLPYISTLRGDFVFDDTEAVINNKDVTSDNWLDCFHNDYWGTNIRSNLSHKSYRPLTILTFRLNYHLNFKTLSAYGFKLTNLVCHVICTVLVYLAIKDMINTLNSSVKNKGKEMDMAYITSLLFAVHPIHTEAVCGIVGRADLLAGATFFLAIIFYNKSMSKNSCRNLNLIIAMIIAGMSLLFKENGITVLGFCLCYDMINKLYLKNKHSKISELIINHFFVRVLVTLISIVLFLYLRWNVMGASNPMFSKTDNPAAFSKDILTRIKPKMDGSFHKCRLCLKLGDFCSIYKQDESIKLSEMVMSFADVQIYEGDGLPDRVCSTCIENLSTAYLFKQQCERINNVLRKYPESHIVQPSKTDYNDLFNQEFRMHSIYGSIESDNDQNSVKDANTENHVDNIHEVSDDTDSDIDSVKCVYCNEHHNNLAHICHVECTIEHNALQRSSSSETLVASDVDPIKPVIPADKAASVYVACVLCDEKYDQYDDYVLHINKCTTNVKMRHFVCPICHEIFSDKLVYLDHLKVYHFKQSKPPVPLDPGVDCVDSFTAIYSQAKKPKAVRRQIGWSTEDIYQEIDCVKLEEKHTPTSSPLKNFFSKLGNESFSRQSTPKKVSFRNFIETSKAKTSNYLPFRKYIESYRQKKRNSAYSPIKDGKLQISSKIRLSLPDPVTDSDYGSPSGTSEESWRMKQHLICACEKKIFMLSEFIHDRDRIGAMINELGGVVAENTKMEMLATHFISVLPDDTFTGMMVCALATGKWLLHISYIYDSFRCKKFMRENIYEWMKHPKILEIDSTSVEVAKAAVFWHLELQALNAKHPFEGKQVVLIMKKKYRQYYHMIFKALKAKPVSYDPRTPGSCCSADYCFVDMKIIERVKLRFFARHNVPVFPYQYILVYLLKKGRVDDEHKYLLQECKKFPTGATIDFLNNTY